MFFSGNLSYLVKSAVFLSAVALFLCGLAAVYFKEHSSASIREALDNLESGVLFADPGGRVILFNHTMSRLSGELIGSYPQNILEIEAALSQIRTTGRSESGIEAVSAEGSLSFGKESDLFRFKNGRIWQFVASELTDSPLEGFVRIMAWDMTDICKANESLRAENEALVVANQQMLQMVNRIEERVREQETLSFKMKIHNEIGSSLVVLSSLADGEESGDMEEQMKTLQSAVRSFLGNQEGMEAQEDVFGEVRRQAQEMNLTLAIKGFYPTEKETKALAASAIRECLTNCARHAGGRQVEVVFSTDARGFLAEITNDGKQPAGPITEGTGLSGLRKSVEQARGEMRVEVYPRFKLVIVLPRG
ncbi:MAG: hypothetical protein IJ679_09085 [Lachnospiraceae bacterium]|nr:hypothetical protein [Lachnospiraceae bacterium]